MSFCVANLLGLSLWITSVSIRLWLPAGPLRRPCSSTRTRSAPGLGSSSGRELIGRGAARAEDAHGTPTQRHKSPSIPAYEYQISMGGYVGAFLPDAPLAAPDK